MSDPASQIEFRDFDFERHFAFALDHHFELIREHLPDWDAGQAGAKLYEAHVKEITHDPCCRIWVGELEGRPVALIEASFRPNFSPAVGHISDVYVVPDLRRRGIGARMMKTAEDWLKSQGASSVDLNVNALNENAIILYRKLGYDTHQLNMKKPLK
ncbi:MAG: GNAT family N-acetyltransferase [Planctomycetes bacterium]|nr:GNAT family N-acetyltransferase [Planctomycetota bacterium]